jgi:hypothetical protein
MVIERWSAATFERKAPQTNSHITILCAVLVEKDDTSSVQHAWLLVSEWLGRWMDGWIAFVACGAAPAATFHEGRVHSTLVYVIRDHSSRAKNKWTLKKESIDLPSRICSSACSASVEWMPNDKFGLLQAHPPIGLMEGGTQ